MSDFITPLQRFMGGREGCFESAAQKVDAVAVCHEVRSLSLKPGEKISVTFRVSGRRDGEHFLVPGEMCHLKSLNLDSVVLVGVWASSDAGVAASKLLEPGPPPRACGEVRVPLRHLVQKCDGALYHSWLMLDSPGLNDSVASIGLLDAGGLDAGEAFSQALSNAPRQLLQPKACISLCKVEALGPSGQPLWTADAPRKERIAHWGPLLRSQQQHVVMCAAQHLQGAQVQRDRRSQVAEQLQALEEQATEQATELQGLREQVRRQQEASRLDSTADGGPVSPMREHGNRQGSSDEAARQREVGEQLEQELAGLREELTKIGEEANSKIEAANVRIRSLRQERDQAVREVEQQSMETRKLQENKDELNGEKVKLTEQKEALLKIVEDLHQTCNMPEGRKQMDSIPGFKFT